MLLPLIIFHQTDDDTYLPTQRNILPGSLRSRSPLRRGPIHPLFSRYLRLIVASGSAFTNYSSDNREKFVRTNRRGRTRNPDRTEYPLHRIANHDASISDFDQILSGRRSLLDFLATKRANGDGAIGTGPSPRPKSAEIIAEARDPYCGAALISGNEIASVN